MAEAYTDDDIREALAPLRSLASKSEKARSRLGPDTWQHAMLGENIKALQFALALMDGAECGAPEATGDELEGAIRALDSMIARVENTQTKFAPGTSQHSLQRNRLKALRVARAVVETELAARA